MKNPTAIGTYNSYPLDINQGETVEFKAAVARLNPSGKPKAKASSLPLNHFVRNLF